MNHLIGWLILALVTVSILSAAGPTLVGLAHAAAPLVIAVGAVLALLRVVWHFTNRY